jgi:hypothetical protein
LIKFILGIIIGAMAMYYFIEKDIQGQVEERIGGYYEIERWPEGDM